MATTRNKKRALKNRLARSKIKLVKKIRRVESTIEIKDPSSENYWYSVAVQLKTSELRRVLEGGCDLFETMKHAADTAMVDRVTLEK